MLHAMSFVLIVCLWLPQEGTTNEFAGETIAISHAILKGSNVILSNNRLPCALVGEVAKSIEFKLAVVNSFICVFDPSKWRNCAWVQKCKQSSFLHI